MRPDYILWSSIFFLLVIGVGSFVLIDGVNNYGIDYDNSTFGSTYSLSSEMYDIATTQKEDVLDADIDEDDAQDSGIKGMSRALKIMGKMPNQTAHIFMDVGEEVGVPFFIIDYLIIGITITILFSVGYLFFRVFAR